MSRWLVYNGIPYEEIALMEEWELLANAIIFAQFHNGCLSWDWDNMEFIEEK